MGDDNLPTLPDGSTFTCRKMEFIVIEKLGEGGFGAVYKVQNTKTDEVCAMKCEHANEEPQVLKAEVIVLKELHQSGAKHVCKLIGKGKHPPFNYVLMSLLGKSLSDLRKARRHARFTPQTALLVANQTLCAIRDLHNIGYIHRDLKPGNFAIGRKEEGKQRIVFMLDFGMCRKFRTDSGDLRYPRAAAAFRGTVRYAALASHRHREQSRRDDLESWVYMNIEMATGRLPWGSMKQKHEVALCKEAARTQSGLRSMLQPDGPEEYGTILLYLDQLQYWDPPDYDYMLRLLDRRFAEKYKVALDDAMEDKNKFPLDWETKETKEPKPNEPATAKGKTKKKN